MNVTPSLKNHLEEREEKKERKINKDISDLIFCTPP